MQETFKFRIWDSKMMKYSTLASFVFFAYHLFNFQMTDEQEERYKVLRFTELYDKNGREIYEGDILKARIKTSWMNDNVEEYRMEVKYQVSKSGETGLAGFLYIPEDREVVGNIFENPELIKKP